MHLSAKSNMLHFSDIKEPQIIALLGVGRSGTKFLQTHLDGHESILMIPGYPLTYLYPHFDSWCKQFSEDLSWNRIIDLFCEKHASVLDSRKILGLSGLERLGPDRNEHIEINEQMFRDFLKAMLDGVPIQRRSFLLAVHYAYGLCKQWDLKSKTILFYHIHDVHFFSKLVEDFPNLKLIWTVRNPRAGIHSGFRIQAIIDQKKLNITDGLRLRGRGFLLACHYQFDVYDYLRNYLDEAQATVVRLEDFQNIESIMKRLAGWLGIDFSENMLKSTFDGKSWWGDYGSTKEISRFNTDILSDRWKESMGRFDLFAIEGISFNFFKRYNYNLLVYKHDTLINRLLLIFAILAPTRIEWQLAAFYFDPRVHIRFIRAAFDESSGRLPRKDYTWNATYLYKWTYIDLQLWHKRWHERFLDLANECFEKNRRSPYASFRRTFSRAVYVIAQYGRFWVAIFLFPMQIFKRWGIFYMSLYRRIRKYVFLPRLLS